MKQPNIQRQRRAKQFAIVTVFAAVCLTAAPLVFLLAWQPADDNVDTDQLLEEINADEVTGTFRPVDDTPPLRELPEVPARHDAAPTITAVRRSTPVPPSAREINGPEELIPTPFTRVATAESRLDTVVRSPTISAEILPPPSVRAVRSDLPEGLRPPTIRLPVIFTEPMASTPQTPASTDAAGDLEFETDIREIEEAIAPDVVPSTFGATGHLSVAGMEPPEKKRPAKPVPGGADEKELAGRSSKKRRRGTHAEEPNVEISTAKARPTLVRPVAALPPSPDEPAALPPGPVEDVVLQTPLETSTVHRIENVIGATRAVGWPVILIRSDLPDDQWWVQQMVSAGGNSFSGRVNFGNEHSVTGSVYHMVIVFLDSPDEMRRFRIAKQFRELPEGIRHSRRFTYVRR